MSLKFNVLRTLFYILASVILVSCEEILFEEDLSNRSVTIIAPTNNTTVTSDSVNFSWNMIEDADSYQIQIATPAFANATQLVLDSLLTDLSLNQILESNVYEWRIRALNESSETPYTTVSFMVQPETYDDDLSAEIVELIAPTDGAVLEINPITFSWEEVDFAEEYVFQIATPDFDTAIQLNVDEVLMSTSSQQTLDDGMYQWRVKARNSVSETAYSTNDFTVSTIIDFADREVIIVAPPDNYVSNIQEINLQWLPVLDAMLYRVQVLDPNDNSILDEQTTTETNIVLTFPEGEYLWQVRAENGSESTQYSTQSIIIDTTAPNIPQLLTPLDLEVLASTQVNFTWSRENIDGTIEKDSLYLYLDASLNNLVLKEEVSGGSFSTALSNQETYFWFMKAFDGAGNQSDDSDLYSFSIDE